MDENIRTQKARGISFLSRVGGDVHVPNFQLIQSREQISKAYRNMRPRSAELFARPCPVQPRHGFVDSRPIADELALLKLWDETVVHDPDAEVVLMSRIDAAQSGIVSGNLAVIGTGNDGATSGKEGSVSLPLALVNWDWTRKADLVGNPFLELVQSKGGHVYVVQLRDGPVIAGNGEGNWIPRAVTVRHVLPAQGDLLEWEQTTKHIQQGAVVWNPSGNMLSHYAIHAVLNNIPIVFDAVAPEIGAKLKRTSAKSKINQSAFQLGLMYGLTLSCDNCPRYKNMLAVALFVTHQSTALMNTRQGAIALGIGAAFFLKLGAAACAGEYRHYAYSQIHEARVDVYDHVMRDYAEWRPRMKKIFRAFATGKWRTSNYGGLPWAQCVRATCVLDSAVAQATKPVCTKRDVKAVMAALNAAVNLAHNDGWWLNKFGSQSLCDLHAAGDISSIAAASFDIANLVRSVEHTVSPRVQYRRLAVPFVRARMQARIANVADSRGIAIQLGFNQHYISTTISVSAETAETMAGILPKYKKHKSFNRNSSAVYYEISTTTPGLPYKVYAAMLKLAANAANTLKEVCHA